MLEISIYILKSRGDRTSHLDLSLPCIERGGNSIMYRGLLAHYLNTSIPTGRRIHLCHACHNAKCSNPVHLYWGTAKENRADATENGANSVWINTIIKYGPEGAKLARKRSSESYQKSGKKVSDKLTGLGKTELHKERISRTLTGSIMVTDGTRNIRIKAFDEIPLGFTRGMTRKKLANIS